MHARCCCRFDERLWQPGETRVYTVRSPPGGDAALKAYSTFRLVVGKTPGRRADESYAGISEWRFLTGENMPPFCESLQDVALNITLAGTPTDAAGAGAPNYSLYIYVNVTNTGLNAQRLKGLHLPVRFSRAVQSWDGTWAIQAPSSFNTTCWGAYQTDPAALADPWRARYAAPVKDACHEGAVSATGTDWGVDIAFSSGILCPGCRFTGPPGSLPMFVLQHSSFGSLDVASAIAIPAACGAIDPPPAPLPLPGPERHPACVPWATGSAAARTPPGCLSSADLASLRVRIGWTYADGAPALPGGPPQPSRELRIRPSITNAGTKAVNLFGVTVPISFSHRVMADGGAWAVAPPTAFQLDCFWAQIVTSAGAPIYGQPNSCEFMSINATATGLQLTFLGGRLCAGCTLAGGNAATDATINVKHMAYQQLESAPQPALGPLSCAPLSAPPLRCAGAVSPLAAGPAPSTQL